MPSKRTTQTSCLILSQVTGRMCNLIGDLKPEGKPKITKAYREYAEYELYQCIASIRDVIAALERTQK